ncbi:hypothetical protein [Spirillospora sp. NPDC047279]|uniref:hypothetical protein n=1 Tax=Spirillospora sp. NPDC047279 TaxID=3155478 RepID=UPI0034051256
MLLGLREGVVDGLADLMTCHGRSTSFPISLSSAGEQDGPMFEWYRPGARQQGRRLVEAAAQRGGVVVVAAVSAGQEDQ